MAISRNGISYISFASACAVALMMTSPANAGCPDPGSNQGSGDDRVTSDCEQHQESRAEKREERREQRHADRVVSGCDKLSGDDLNKCIEEVRSTDHSINLPSISESEKFREKKAELERKAQDKLNKHRNEIEELDRKEREELAKVDLKYGRVRADLEREDGRLHKGLCTAENASDYCKEARKHSKFWGEDGKVSKKEQEYLDAQERVRAEYRWKRDQKGDADARLDGYASYQDKVESKLADDIEKHLEGRVGFKYRIGAIGRALGGGLKTIAKAPLRLFRCKCNKEGVVKCDKEHDHVVDSGTGTGQNKPACDGPCAQLTAAPVANSSVIGAIDMRQSIGLSNAAIATSSATQTTAAPQAPAAAAAPASLPAGAASSTSGSAGGSSSEAIDLRAFFQIH